VESYRRITAVFTVNSFHDRTESVILVTYKRQQSYVYRCDVCCNAVRGRRVRVINMEELNEKQ
jgi:hypothetical protein